MKLIRAERIEGKMMPDKGDDLNIEKMINLN